MILYNFINSINSFTIAFMNFLCILETSKQVNIYK